VVAEYPSPSWKGSQAWQFLRQAEREIPLVVLIANEAEEPALSASVGIASYSRDADTIGTLFYSADKAMYEMKEKGLRIRQASIAASAT
jgi:GGDEF domain-containing protein